MAPVVSGADDLSTAASSMVPGAWLATCQLLLVALLWGTTNPFLNRASKPTGTAGDQAGAATTGAAAAPDAATPGLLSLLRNWRFVLPFALNQLGSVLYLSCLSSLSLSVAVPAVNALTMLLTALTAWALGERSAGKINKRVMAGMVLILVGVSVCIISEQQKEVQTQTPQEL